MRHPTVHHPIGLSLLLAVGLFVASVIAPPAQAREGTKSLKLYFGHTKERGEFTFKRNGRYDKGEIKKINRFLRDWRRNEPANMDPQLLDLIWAIYKQTGSREYIHVVSAYRSLATNNTLRSRSKGVAKTSQHTAGKAMDFYIPGVPLAKLRGIAMKAQGGGVGFYPTSGSPFVHVDTGNVRSWPRMSRQQLIALFPDGETLYLPTDGKPLKGYEKALARKKSSGGTALAYLETGEESGGGKKSSVGGWLKRVFDGGADEAEDTETAAAPAPVAPPPAVPPTAAPAVEDPAAPVEPATGDPTVLIAAAEDGSEPRVPRARPATESELMLASIAPDLPPGNAAAPAAVALPSATAAEALPAAPASRGRPDSVLLAETLAESGAETAALAVEPEDVIAALTALSDTPVSAAQAAGPAPLPVTVQVAEAVPAPVAPAPVVPAPVAPAEVVPAPGPGPAAVAAAGPIRSAVTPEERSTAIAAANALVAGAGGNRPRPRPVALAFAGSGLPAAEPVKAPVRPAALPAPVSVSAPEPVPQIQVPEIQVARAEASPEPKPLPAVKGDRVEAAIAAVEEPAYGADADDLRELIGKAAARRAATEGFTMPEPAGAPSLFSAPANAAAVTEIAKQPRPPVNKFKVSEAEQPARKSVKDATQEEGSFFSKLFASLAE